MLPFCFIFI